MQDYNFVYGKKYILVRDNLFDSMNKYTLVSFVCDRYDKNEIVLEIEYPLMRFLHIISYKKLEKKCLYTLEEFIPIIDELISNISKKEKCELPPKYFLQKYKKLNYEIIRMEDKLKNNCYEKNKISCIHKSIKQKQKAMRRIKKRSYKYFNACGVSIDELKMKGYNYSKIQRNEDRLYLLQLKRKIENILQTKS